VRVGSHAAYALDIAAVDGDTETLFLDATTWLPLELAYDEDDGRTTLDFSDWRSVSGHRFPYVTVASDGSHAFDTTETTTQLTVGAPVEAAVFALPVSRTIEMSGTETLKLSEVQQHLYVPVRIAGRTYTFLVDTGAESVVLDRRVAREAGLKPQGALEASGAARIGGAQIALLPELTVGSGRLRDLVVTVLDLGATTSGTFRIDGILGYPFFAATVARIDPDALTLTFGAPGALAPRGERVPLEVDRALPEARLRLDGLVDANFVIDTGNSAELLIYRPFADTHAGLSPYSSDSRQSFGIGGSMSSYATSVDELDFGSIPLYHAYAEVMLSTSGAFADRFDAGNVGLGLLRNFAFTLDPNDGALYLEKSADFNDGRRRI
jgi:predicted aspartyl protease